MTDTPAATASATPAPASADAASRDGSAPLPAPIVALLDGTLVDVTTPIVRADDLGVVRGDGVFDVAHVRERVVDGLDAHLERLAASARILALPEPDEAGFRRAVDALVDAWDWQRSPEGVVRLVMTRGAETGGTGPSAWAMLSPMSPAVIREREGVRVVVLDRGMEAEGTVDLPWLLPGAKSLSYGINMAAKRWAVANGADDALFVTPNGRLLEGPTSTLVVDLDGALRTPAQDGILKSTTLEALFAAAPGAGLDLEFADLRLDDLERVRGAWLLSSGRVLAPITHLDGREVPRSPQHEVLARVLGVPGAA